MTTPDDKPILFLFHGDSCRCKACHRRLSDPDSIRRGVGPSCWKKGGGERYQFMIDFDEAVRA